ncbi:unnamed protein product [Caenorhabditis bovis]|uniref:Major sperm protein n=1 Tax=Caenorhabditis bovis TaxID=2654633 RepID=A0A8S1EVV9_9PELO|nr:unnamed protein product [Caenorhabditis bovis]
MAQSVPPGDIQTQPNAKIVFNAPYDDKHTYHIKVINSSARRIGYGIKTTNMKRLGVDPPCGVLDPKEAVLLAVSCDAFAFGQEDTNNDRITVEWTNTPDGAAKQFRREWFQGDGMIFIHRTFAYKGVVVCSFPCRVHEKKAGQNEKHHTTRDYYQVLIHRHDWSHMGFPVDITSYLVEAANGRNGEKLLTLINGMDCVGHDDIIPYTPCGTAHFDHDLFDRIFNVSANEDGLLDVEMKPELLESYRSSHRSWLAPRDVYRERTENIEVTVLTFYLGVNNVSGQQQHMWRYVIRIENKVPEKAVILRERSLKIYSLNNMNQMHGHGVVGKQPELNVVSPAFQFSSTIELKHSKGGHMWGRFKMERENGVMFDVHIPTIVLESTDEIVENSVTTPEKV